MGMIHASGNFWSHVASVCWLTKDIGLKSNQKPPILIYRLWLSLGSRKNVEHYSSGKLKRTHSCLGSWSALQREAQENTLSSELLDDARNLLVQKSIAWILLLTETGSLSGESNTESCTEGIEEDRN
ncbi:hypothetical protein H5410_033657, partial [Solanum commersonii]